MSKYGWRDNKINVKEISFPGKTLVSEVIPNCAAIASAGLLAAWDVSAGTAALDNSDFDAQPPYPLCIQVYAVVGGTADNGDIMNITGYNAKGNLITEGVAIASTAKGSNYSNNAFMHITSIVPDDAAHKSTDVNIGWGQEFGLRYDLQSEADILSLSYDGAYATADGGATPLTVNTQYDTVTLPTMADTKTLKISYLSRKNE